MTETIKFACSWCARFWQVSINKVTNWFALALSGLAVLPEILPQYWSQIEGIFPTSWPTERVHHILLGVGALAIIYLRGRRAMKAQP